jgi:hypothetical protein
MSLEEAARRQILTFWDKVNPCVGVGTRGVEYDRISKFVFVPRLCCVTAAQDVIRL